MNFFEIEMFPYLIKKDISYHSLLADGHIQTAIRQSCVQQPPSKIYSLHLNKQIHVSDLIDN